MISFFQPEVDGSDIIAVFRNGLQGQISLAGRIFSNGFLERAMTLLDNILAG